ncbi:acetate--CoA ligase family protein [Aminobacter anthyllidis]|uniref:Acetate--CoA ligase family protein n=1 Tax=Aminobacter anthyllidis TaxID=1035067 RepID=A0A9X1AGP9_9HYPH|nr:acetate--CoA ligase family protein [Aminobacter anthyllidis]MBT1159413.1 acetate--CoA ligase family protein [Aminobacter anthyllidis]
MQTIPQAIRHARDELDLSLADLQRMFRKKTGIAYVGRVDASPQAHNWFRRFGEDVRFCYVNPRGGEAGGVPVFTSMAEVPDYIDLAVVKVAPAIVPQVIADCGRRGVRDVIVFSSGFSEVGAEGAALEAKVAAAAREHGVRVIGPNTNDNTFEQFPIPEQHRGGLIGLVTQSGFNGRPIVEGVAMGAAFRRWVTVGNEVDLEVADFINYFAHDPQTSVIAAYVEGFKSIAKLRLALEAANAMKKPVVMLKMGSTERGARMAASHTGHLAGADAVINGLFKQYGVIRVRDLDELLETANLLAKLPVGTGPNCALYSVSGGSTTLMAELADSYGVSFPELSPATIEKLYTYLPNYVAVSNPIDNGGGFVITAPQQQRIDVLETIAADENVDVIVVGLTAALGLLSDSFAADVLAFAPRSSKPIVAVWGSVLTDSPGYRDLVKSGVPIFRSFRKCFRAMRARADYEAAKAAFRRRSWQATPLSVAQQIALRQNGLLDSRQSADLLEGAGIDRAQECLVTSPTEAADRLPDLGGRVVMKLASPDIAHKSDAGLVELGITDDTMAASVFDVLVAKAKAHAPDARIEGVLMQEQIGSGVEMIVGLTQDPDLGPTITVGAGGIYAEILKDAATRPLPVDRDDIREMIASLRLSPLLDGARGAAPSNKEALVELVFRTAQLGLAAGTSIVELDLNPVIVLPTRAVAVDALVVSRTID